jgi:hypothetical protein
MQFNSTQHKHDDDIMIYDDHPKWLLGWSLGALWPPRGKSQLTRDLTCIGTDALADRKPEKTLENRKYLLNFALLSSNEENRSLSSPFYRYNIIRTVASSPNGHGR